jgi:hypothetical protein
MRPQRQRRSTSLAKVSSPHCQRSERTSRLGDFSPDRRPGHSDNPRVCVKRGKHPHRQLEAQVRSETSGFQQWTSWSGRYVTGRGGA